MGVIHATKRYRRPSKETISITQSPGVTPQPPSQSPLPVPTVAQLSSTPQNTDTVVYNGSFDSVPDWRASVKPSMGSDNNFEIVPGGYEGMGLLAKYKKGSYAGDSSSVGKSATIFRINFDERGSNIGPREEMYFQFRVKFMKGFQFNKTGKLPGLAGGTSNTGGNPPNGMDGWSVRTVWRGNTLASYLYVLGIERYGIELPWSDSKGKPTVISTGSWNCITLRVKMNDASKRNGIVEGWLNDVKQFSKVDLQFRTIAGLKIDNILFDTFFGGSSPEFASPIDQSAVFDSLLLSNKQPSCS